MLMGGGAHGRCSHGLAHSDGCDGASGCGAMVGFVLQGVAGCAALRAGPH
jgi:hypothetical protein